MCCTHWTYGCWPNIITILVLPFVFSNFALVSPISFVSPPAPSFNTTREEKKQRFFFTSVALIKTFVPTQKHRLDMHSSFVAFCSFNEAQNDYLLYLISHNIVTISLFTSARFTLSACYFNNTNYILRNGI